MVAAAAAAVRHELVGLGGVVERNWYLVKRYVWWEVAFFLWTCANTLTIVFISKGINAPPALQNELATKLLIGGVIWAYLGIIFEILTETVSWERWEGTIEYTFMSPLSRPVHLFGMGIFAVGYGVVGASLLFFWFWGFFFFFLLAAHARRQLRRGARAARDRIGLVHRDRDDDRGPAADLAREGNTARLHCAGVDARRVGRLLRRRRPAAVDAVDRGDLAGDVRVARHPRGDPRRDERAVGRHLAAARDRRRVGAARAVRVPDRRALRQATRKAEAVRMIELRASTTDADYEAWLGVRRAVLPTERAPSLDELKASIGPNDAHLLADLDGELAGSGLMNRSDVGGAHVAPRVLPDKRGRGVGTALLMKLASMGVERGF